MTGIAYAHGDTSPVGVQLGVDLTGSTAVFHVHPRGDRTTILATATLTITNPTKGLAEFTPPPALAAGTYAADAVITNGLGKTRTTVLTGLTVQPHS